MVQFTLHYPTFVAALSFRTNCPPQSMAGKSYGVNDTISIEKIVKFCCQGKLGFIHILRSISRDFPSKLKKETRKAAFDSSASFKYIERAMIQTYFKLRSTSFALLSWIFIAAFMLDAANVEDLVLNNIVIHDDADVISPPEPGLSTAPHVFPITGKLTPPKSGKNLQATSLPSIRVIYDQDSISLAPESAGEDLSMDLYLHESFLDPVSYTSCSSLYLLHCSLLI